jgi:hypothetical protein
MTGWSFLWSEPWFLQLAGRSQRVYLYLATHPDSNSLGVIAGITPDSVALALRIDRASVAVAVSELGSEVVTANGIAWVRRRLQAHPPWLPQDVKRWGREIAGIPDERIRNEVILECARVALTLSEAKFKALPPVVRARLGEVKGR